MSSCYAIRNSCIEHMCCWLSVAFYILYRFVGANLPLQMTLFLFMLEIVIIVIEDKGVPFQGDPKV